MDRLLLLYTTFPDEAAAAATAQALVEAGLAACVNILPGMCSVYAWRGAVEQAEEVSVLVKTREGLAEPAAELLRARHPYDTPIVLTWPVQGDAATTAWLLAETAPRTA